MPNAKQPEPRRYNGVTISSTFEDLKEHRQALIEILTGQGFFPVAMENDSALTGADVIDSSLQKVRDGVAYVGIIGRRYGQIPECPTRNPHNVSITELEFEEALRLGRPILLFLMGERHPLHAAEAELDAKRGRQLQAFRERAKRMGPDSRVDRVYATFNSLEDFKELAAQAIARLHRDLLAQVPATAPHPALGPGEGLAGDAPTPSPPAFCAEPPYIGSHRFVGRQAELERLSAWAKSADPHPILLLEAIGGTGKSMLTWEWTTNHATAVREDWAGRFWYSFYERGAVMTDFCQRALAYITGRPLKEFRKPKTPELGDLLLRHLQARPWLLVLDGLERVLVAYHRYDAAQLADEDAGTSDQIARRDPLDAIRPEDDEFLRLLASAAPSKLLLTSRLMPRVLLNKSSQPIPGVVCMPLAGLRPPDAEALLCSTGITGTSRDIQNYLEAHCDCHPLVTGVLAGLINNYLPDRGNFDAWAADPTAGGQLNLANLDLVQKRNHILHAALAALPEKSRELLSMLALVSGTVDYATLSALNPHLPPMPVAVPKPVRPARLWGFVSTKLTIRAQKEYQQQLQRWREYTHAMAERSESAGLSSAPAKLAESVRDLERRGLLQYDHQARRYDLHPVVRGVAAGGLEQEEKNRYGQQVLDHFSQQAHRPYDQAESLEDVRQGLQVVRTLIQMGRREQAFRTFEELDRALYANLEAYSEILSLVRAFLPRGWNALPGDLPPEMASVLAHQAGIALYNLGMPTEALEAYGTSILAHLREKEWTGTVGCLEAVSHTLDSQGRLAKMEYCVLLALELAELLGSADLVFTTRLSRFNQLVEIGNWEAAGAIWRLLDPMGRKWSRNLYRLGHAETSYAIFHFKRQDLSEHHLVSAERNAELGQNRSAIRTLHWLRGCWRLEQGEWALAARSLDIAVRMAREVGIMDSEAEGHLAVAKLRLGQLREPSQEAERLATAGEVHHRSVAELWLAIGNAESAKEHALAAYQAAWADGEPYVYRYELSKASALLEQLDVEAPELPPYDPAKDEKFPWEPGVTAAIEKLRRQKRTAGRTANERSDG